LEPLQFRDIARSNYVVEADVLKRNLFNRFLKVKIVKHFKRIAVYEKFVVALDLCVTTLD